MDDCFRRASVHRFQWEPQCVPSCREEIKAPLETETKTMATLIAPMAGQCASILSTITETELAGG